MGEKPVDLCSYIKVIAIKMDHLNTKHKFKKSYYSFLTLCYISISFNIGCKRKGVYGTACNISCPVACKNETCHIQHGTCLECELGLYGNYCNLPCPINCYDNTCHMQNGTCFTCKPGWTGINCNTSKNAYHILHLD